MPRSKTTESRNNIHKGVRKLSKKASKKGSKNKKKNYNTSTEDMLDILNSDKNVYTGNSNMNQQQVAMMNQFQQNVFVVVLCMTRKYFIYFYNKLVFFE